MFIFYIFLLALFSELCEKGDCGGAVRINSLIYDIIEE